MILSALKLLLHWCYRCHPHHFILPQYQGAGAAEKNGVEYHQYNHNICFWGKWYFEGLTMNLWKATWCRGRQNRCTTWSRKSNLNLISTWGKWSAKFSSALMSGITTVNNKMRRKGWLDISRNLDPRPFQWRCDSQILSSTSTMNIMADEDYSVGI